VIRDLKLAESHINEAEKALAVGMSEKAKEFVATGGEIYHGNKPDGADGHHKKLLSY